MPGLWLMIWGIVGLFFLVLLFGRAFGTEALIARADGVTLMRRLLLWSVPSEVPARSIEWIDWISDDPDIKVTVNGRRVPQPAIAIVAGKEVLRCARGIGETEADAAIAAIRQRLKLPRRPA